MNIVLSEVLKSIRDSDLPVIKVESLPQIKGLKLSVSRFEIGTNGYEIWIDFEIPKSAQIASGTLELCLSHSGQITQKEISGHLLRLNDVN